MKKDLDFVIVGLYRKDVPHQTIAKIHEFYPDSKIFIITKKDDISLFHKLGCPNLITIDEDTVVPNMTGKQFFEKYGKFEICGFYWQQILKLYSYCVPEIPNEYLLQCIDYIPLRHINYIEDGKYLFNSNKFELEVHKRPYNNDHYLALTEDLLGKHDVIDTSLVTEHMVMNKKYAKEFLQYVENAKGKNLVEYCFYAWQNNKMLMAEYSLYQNYMLIHHKDKCRVRTLKYLRNASDFYYKDTKGTALKVFEKLWELDAIAIEDWKYKDCGKAVHTAMSKIRVFFNFYKRLPLSMPRIEKGEDLFSDKFNKKYSLVSRVFRHFSEEFWLAKKHRIVVLLLIVASVFYLLIK